MKYKILFAEDEIDLGNVVKQYLEIMDFEVCWCTSGAQALERFTTNPQDFQIAVLDISMPGMNGFELSEHILKIKADMPFLFLTARSEKKDKLHGLRLGADDYITKPFDIDELVLRLKNILKRNNATTTTTVAPYINHLIERHDVTFNKDTLTLTVAGEATILTVREAELLEYLFLNSNRILKREEILVQLWGENDYFLGRSLDVFISRLRKHISKSSKINIKNVYGVGFVFAC